MAIRPSSVVRALVPLVVTASLAVAGWVGGAIADVGGQGSNGRCQRAWDAFVASDGLQNHFRDVVPTLSACADLDEWTRVGKTTPGHVLIVTESTARNLCRFQAGVEHTHVCRSLSGSTGKRLSRPGVAPPRAGAHVARRSDRCEPRRTECRIPTERGAELG